MSIVTLLEIAEGVYGDRIAVGSRIDGCGVTYARMLGAVRSFGARSELRLARHLVYLGSNGPRFPVFLFGAACTPGPLVPLNFRLSAAQVGGLLDQLGSSLVLADEAHRDLAVAATCARRDRASGRGNQAASTDDVISAEECYDKALASADEVGPTATASDDVAVLLFTSGTTSTPKAVVLRHEQLVAYVLQTVELASADEDEAILVSVPPYHVAGVGTVLTNVYAGRRIVFLPDFEPVRWLDLVRREGITNAMVVPTMLARVVDALDGAPAGVPTLRTLAYGGARMPPSVLERAMDAFPGVGFVNAYGLTETSSTVAVLGPEDHREAFGHPDPTVRSRLGSVGRLVPDVEGQIRDPDGTVTTAGEVGELWVRGPQVSGEYRGSGSVLDAQGWFPTRDLARFDTAGYLFIEGRADDTIIRGGENIAPAEIETVIEGHPAVKEVGVVGVADDEWGQRIVAVVVARDGHQPDGEELRQFVRGRVRGSRTPDQVVFVEELPYGPTGKLLRRQLVQGLEVPSPGSGTESTSENAS